MFSCVRFYLKGTVFHYKGNICMWQQRYQRKQHKLSVYMEYYMELQPKHKLIPEKKNKCALMHIKNKEGNYLQNAEILNYIKTENIPLFMFKQINRRYSMWKIHFPLFLYYDIIQFSQVCFSLSIRCISCQSSLTPLWPQFYF